MEMLETHVFVSDDPDEDMNHKKVEKMPASDASS